MAWKFLFTISNNFSGIFVEIFHFESILFWFQLNEKKKKKFDEFILRKVNKMI